MGIIGINKLDFPVTLSNMQEAGNAINGKISAWKTQGELSKALKKFADDYELLQSIIKDYKKLVQNDICQIRKIGIELVDMDEQLKRFWR